MAMYEERCLHSDVCKYGKNRTNGMYCTGERCLHFIDRTKLADGVKTNADRIRAMSDEELEPTILAFKLGYAPWCDHHCKNEGEYGCDTCILNWLKQPAE